MTKLNRDTINMMVEAIAAYCDRNRYHSGKSESGGEYFPLYDLPKPGDILRIVNGRIVVVEEVGEPEKIGDSDYGHTEFNHYIHANETVCDVKWRPATVEEMINFLDFHKPCYAVLLPVDLSGKFYVKKTTLAEICHYRAPIITGDYRGCDEDGPTFKIAYCDDNKLCIFGDNTHKPNVQFEFASAEEANLALLLCEYTAFTDLPVRYYNTWEDAEDYRKRAQAESDQHDIF